MKRKLLRPMFLLILAVLPVWHLSAATELEDFLETLPLKGLKVIEKEAFYSHIYEVMFEQPIDHAHPEKGTFFQRLYISHTDNSSPTVLVTEGYSADYYYTSEPAALLKCNQIIAEHRYFGESVPDTIMWEYLTVWQSASDQHEIIRQFRKFYTGKWITTGISKGGQTTLYHSYFYPDDVDARIPYVAPLNMSVEDERIYEFLHSVGTRDCRRKIRKFQKFALRHEDDLIPAFKDFSDRKGYTYELAGGVETAFEYCVLEYSFAFWQWGYASCSMIPGKKDSPEEIIAHMNKVAGFDYFADEFILEYRPFYYQAYTQMGYYGYNIEAFRNELRHVTEPGFRFALPEDMDIHFDNSTQLALESYLKNEAENFILIYGEYDTWSATAVDPGANKNIKVFYKEKGSHRTRIKNMPTEQQEEIRNVLIRYLSD